MYWVRRLFGSRAWTGPASNNTQVRQEPNIATIVVEGQLKRSGSGRRKAMFPMLYLNSVRQRFIQPRLLMVYIKQKTTEP